jgi:hypothetical protein
MVLAVERKYTATQKLCAPSKPSTQKKLGKYQRLVLEALEEKPRFTNELWRLCQASGLQKALKNDAEPNDFSYSFPPFRLVIARSLRGLKARGLICNRLCQGSNAYGISIQRRFWYLATTPAELVERELGTANTVADICGQIAQSQYLALLKRAISACGKSLCSRQCPSQQPQRMTLTPAGWKEA